MLTSGAAALILACLSQLSGREERFARPFSLAALAAGLAGQAALFVSLEQPLRAYEFFLHPAFTSWTAIGAYVVPLFLVGSIAMALRTRQSQASNRLVVALALLPAVAVFVYATNEIMACTGRAAWASPFVPPTFVIAGLAGGVGLAACFASRRKPHGPDSPAASLAGFSAFAAAGCAVMALILPAPAGFAAATSSCWHAPETLCLLTTVVALLGWRTPRRGAMAAGLAGVGGGFLLYWKLIYMGQAFARNAATVADKAALLDLVSGPSLLAVAGTAGLLAALMTLLPVWLPEKNAQTS
jgi:Ni/Fe-hydrogenase subunit HybB-like protein